MSDFEVVLQCGCSMAVSCDWLCVPKYRGTAAQPHSTTPQQLVVVIRLSNNTFSEQNNFVHRTQPSKKKQLRGFLK